MKNSREEYQSIDALNYSGIKMILKSPLHYKQMREGIQKDSKALRIGTMVHQAVLEPDVFKLYKPKPIVDRRTKEGRELMDYFYKTLKEDEVVCDSDEYDFALNLADKISIALEEKGIKFKQTEVTVQAVCGITGVNLKCCIDAIGEDDVIYDIKTTEDGSPNGFFKTVMSYKYYIQSYLYKMMNNSNRFVYIAIEKEPPFAVSFYELGEQFDEKARVEVYKAIDIYKECKSKDIWPGYSQETIKLDLNKI